MQAMAPSRNTDDFDMAKLQKSLSQRQQHFARARPQVAKLTPAEIRALNHSATTSKGTSQQSSRSTPPPDSPTAYQAQVSRASSINLPPTPPNDSPERRRASQSNANHSHHHHGHIHQPRPRASRQADLLIANGVQSRRSSGSNSSVRSLPTYRGHEVTRTGSLTMIQRPAQDIVANPLSQFSRPRQATINSAPDPRRDLLLDMDPAQAEAMLNADKSERSSVDQDSVPSPVKQTDSPALVNGVELEGTSPDEPSVGSAQPIDGRRATAASVAREITLEDVTNPMIAIGSPAQQLDLLSGVQEPALPPNKAEQASAKAPRKRFSFHAGFFERKDKDPTLVTKKNRRRTVSFTKSGPDAKSAATEDVTAEAKYPSPETSGDDIPAHPAIRPLSPVSTRSPSTPNTKFAASSEESGPVQPRISSNDKGKSALTPLTVPKNPVYGRCACCGKIKRPAGFAAELSPVLENENIRTNFSLESERPRTSQSSGSNDTAKPRRYTPIIPMEVMDEGKEGSVRTVQASIEPALEEHEIIPQKRRNSELSKVVRFASLHKPKIEDEDEAEAEAKAEAGIDELKVTSTPVVDPTIEPKTGATFRPRPAAWESMDSIDSLSTASIMTARPVSMSAVKALTSPETEVAKRPKSFTVVKAPSEGSGKASSLGTRSAVIDQWYEQAIKEGPKQDIITVVGWDDHGRKLDVKPEGSEHVEQPAGSSSVKQTSPYESQATHNSNAPSPTKDKESKRKSLLSGALFKKLITSSKPEETKASAASTPTSAVQTSSPGVTSNDSAIFMSGANGLATAQASQNNAEVSTSSAHHLTTTNPPSESDRTKFKQYSLAEDKKGHAYKLSLGLNDDDMSLGLPIPHLGPHFARSNATLRDLVLAQEAPELEKELEAAMASEHNAVTAVRV